MVKRIRRVKITVREKEVTIVKQGTGQTDKPENTQLTVCPVCQSPLHFMANNSPLEIRERNITPLLKEGFQNEVEGEK